MLISKTTIPHVSICQAAPRGRKGAGDGGAGADPLSEASHVLLGALPGLMKRHQTDPAVVRSFEVLWAEGGALGESVPL